MQKTVQTENVRQGKVGRPVFYMLVTSLFLCLVYLIGMSIWALTWERRTTDQQLGVVQTW